MSYYTSHFGKTRLSEIAAPTTILSPSIPTTGTYTSRESLKVGGKKELFTTSEIETIISNHQQNIEKMDKLLKTHANTDDVSNDPINSRGYLKPKTSYNDASKEDMDILIRQQHAVFFFGLITTVSIAALSGILYLSRK